MRPDTMALVVAIAGMMFPAISAFLLRKRVDNQDETDTNL
jgi:hypothetical protein